MKKKALLIVEDNVPEEELINLRSLLERENPGLAVKVTNYGGEDAISAEASLFFSRRDIDPRTIGERREEGWSLIGEDEIHRFFLLYIDMEFDSEQHGLEELWKSRVEDFICSPLLDREEIWKQFCGNELSKKRIYIAPVRSDNLNVIKSIFRIFLSKQIDDIRFHKNSDIKTRYYLTALDLPYKKGDSSERLIPACSNIYKLADSLSQDRLYISKEVVNLLPGNIKRNLIKVQGEGELYSYSFHLLT